MEDPPQSLNARSHESASPKKKFLPMFFFFDWCLVGGVPSPRIRLHLRAAAAWRFLFLAARRASATRSTCKVSYGKGVRLSFKALSSMPTQFSGRSKTSGSARTGSEKKWSGRFSLFFQLSVMEGPPPCEPDRPRTTRRSFLRSLRYYFFRITGSANSGANLPDPVDQAVPAGADAAGPRRFWARNPRRDCWQ